MAWQHYPSNPVPTQPKKSEIAKLVSLVKRKHKTLSSHWTTLKDTRKELSKLRTKIRGLVKKEEKLFKDLKKKCPHVWGHFSSSRGDFFHYWGECSICEETKDHHYKGGWAEMRAHNAKLFDSLNEEDDSGPPAKTPRVKDET